MTEVLATSFLKLDGALGKGAALALMSFFIAISYLFMGFAIKRIQVGIAYAVWELLGVLLILAISFFIFKESLSSTQILGVLLALLGIVLINFGEAGE